MPNPAKIPVPDPGANIFAWALQNPGALAAALKLLNALASAEATLVPGRGAPGRIALSFTGDSCALELPLAFTAPLKIPTLMDITPGTSVATTGSAGSGWGYNTKGQADSLPVAINTLISAVTALAANQTLLAATQAAILAQLRLTGQNPS